MSRDLSGKVDRPPRAVHISVKEVFLVEDAKLAEHLLVLTHEVVDEGISPELDRTANLQTVFTYLSWVSTFPGPLHST